MLLTEPFTGICTADREVHGVRLQIKYPKKINYRAAGTYGRAAVRTGTSWADNEPVTYQGRTKGKASDRVPTGLNLT